MSNRDALCDLNRRVVDCQRCPRLVAYRQDCFQDQDEDQNAPKRYKGQTYWARPVPGFGDPGARVLVVGMAPACHGGNRTGLPFVGSRGGDFLFDSLCRAGFAYYGAPARPGTGGPPDLDSLCREGFAYYGLHLHDIYITDVVKCAVPPPKQRSSEERKQSKSKEWKEWKENCRPFLLEELRIFGPHLRVVVALGREATEGVCEAFQALGAPGQAINAILQAIAPSRPFPHGAIFSLDSDLRVLITSYHPSQRNIQTGLLTQQMMDQIWAQVKRLLLDP